MSPFEDYEVEPEFRPAAGGHEFDLDAALSAVVALEAQVPEDAFTASSLGTERIGNGAVIGPNGLVLTIGYLITEAEDVTLTLNDGRRVAGHPLGADPVTGFGLVQALEPLDLPVLPLGQSGRLSAGSSVILAGAGGRAHAVAGEVLTRMPFAGYWEYLLEDAIMTEPAHPHWSGAALINSRGALVGVGSLSLQRQTPQGVSPLNMCVPIALLPPILDELTRGRTGHPPRPWLGVLAQDMSRQVVIMGVNPKGPAARAGLREGDIVRAVAGEPVTDLAEFYTRVWGLGPAGVDVALQIERDARLVEVEVRSTDRAALLRRPRFN